jgi:hypothetical protein
MMSTFIYEGSLCHVVSFMENANFVRKEMLAFCKLCPFESFTTYEP